MWQDVQINFTFIRTEIKKSILFDMLYLIILKNNISWGNLGNLPIPLVAVLS